MAQLDVDYTGDKLTESERETNSAKFFSQFTI